MLVFSICSRYIHQYHANKKKNYQPIPAPKYTPPSILSMRKKVTILWVFSVSFCSIEGSFFPIGFFKLLSKHEALGGSNGYISPSPPCKRFPGIPFGLCSFSIQYWGLSAIYQKIIFDQDEMNELLGNLKHFHCLKSCKDRVEKERKRDGNANAIIWQTREATNE